MSAVGRQLREHASRSPHGPALVVRGRDTEAIWTWAQLEREASDLDGRIRAATAGRPGGVILAGVDNRGPAVLGLVAALGTEFPVAVVSRSGPTDQSRRLAERLLRAGYDVAWWRDGELTVEQSGAGPGTQPVTSRLPADCVLLPTGGSSGQPKMVLDTLIRTAGLRPRPTRPSSAMNWRPGQRQTVIGPLHHTATLTFFTEGLCDGNTLIVQDRFDPVATLETMAAWRTEWLQVTPYHLRHLALAATRSGGAGLGAVQGLLHLAAPCPEPLKRYWIDALGAERVFEIYGATEGIGLTLVRGPEWLARPGTVGRGFFTQLQIRDESGQRLPAGRTGEVYMRARRPGHQPYLEAGEPAGLPADGYSTVGDRGCLDPDGYLYLAPRQLSRIQVGGETVYPDEVELALCQHPLVLDVAVAGIPDDRVGEALIALVIPARPAGARDLRHYLLSRLPRHQVPREVKFVRALPRAETGKLMRERVAELAAGLFPAGPGPSQDRED
jgi:bile acid-coenzyme A ligase